MDGNSARFKLDSRGETLLNARFSLQVCRLGDFDIAYSRLTMADTLSTKDLVSASAKSQHAFLKRTGKECFIHMQIRPSWRRADRRHRRYPRGAALGTNASQAAGSTVRSGRPELLCMHPRTHRVEAGTVCFRNRSCKEVEGGRGNRLSVSLQVSPWKCRSMCVAKIF